MNTASNSIKHVVYAAYGNLMVLLAGILFLVAAICTELPAEAADTKAAPAALERTATVRLQDLDLSTDAGVQVAQGRLRDKARWLCNRVVEPWTLSHQPDFVRCVDDAVAGAFAQLQAEVAANARSQSNLLSKR